jgi:alginate O-acetyltransferase complex protein AlgF
MRPMIALFISLLWFIPSLAGAGDEGLYEPTPPADSAFVRVIQANSTAKTVTPELGGKSFGKLTYPALSAYQIIPAGEHSFKAGEVTAKLAVEAGRYYSIALTSSAAPALLEDALIANPAKARLYFYNLSDAKETTLFAPKQKAAIFSKQAAGSNTSREINALTLPLQLLVADKLVASLPEVQLKRRAGTSVVLFGTAKNYKALAVENRVAR